MTQKLLSVVLIFVFAYGISCAQESDAMSPPVIEDEMTVDPDQNAQWRTGQNKYPAKPKNMWELGINVGHSFIAGDVESAGITGFGAGLTFRKAINYVLSIRFGGQFTQNKGYDARPLSFNTFQRERTYQQADNQSVLSGYQGSVVHRNYKTTIFSGNLEAILNIGNILFHQERNKWNVYLAGGVGFNVPDVTLDLLDGNSLYDFEGVSSPYDLTTVEGRRDARSDLKDLLDGDYETEGGVENTIAKFGDDKSVIPHFIFSVGVSKKLSDRVNIGIEHQVMLSDNDLLDGFVLRSASDESNNLDIPHYTSIRLGINLGDEEKRTEPLYWVNPLDAPYSDIAELKQRPKFDLTDSDGDGVIDMIDQEKDTPAGCPVDTRGVTLDSDGDGVEDCKDKEPYSPPGYTVDADGVAQVDDPYLTEDEIVQLIESRPQPKAEWFLPMIHFDLDKYYIRPQFFGQLHNVATVMKTHPNLKIVVEGYADNRNPDDYNNVLSYKRANAVIEYLTTNYDIPRERLILNYGGEDELLVEGLPDNHSTSREEEIKHYMNRRVEFRVAGEGDTDMEKPEGPDAGAATPNSSRPGPKYSGNRNSGY